MSEPRCAAGAAGTGTTGVCSRRGEVLWGKGRGCLTGAEGRRGVHILEGVNQDVPWELLELVLEVCTVGGGVQSKGRAGVRRPGSSAGGSEPT